MGSVIRAKCDSCGLDETYRVGSGMLFNKLDKVLPLFDKYTADKISEYLNSGQNSFWYVEKSIGICPECGNVSIYPVFHGAKKQGEEVLLYPDCGCGKKAELLNMETVLDGTRKIPCPKCKNILKISPEGIWD